MRVSLCARCNKKSAFLLHICKKCSIFATDYQWIIANAWLKLAFGHTDHITDTNTFCGEPCNFSQQNDECARVSAYIVLLLRIIIQVLQGPATKYVRVAPFLYEYILIYYM